MKERSGPDSGFTLLELLVSMTVLAVLVVLLLGIVDSAAKLWRENENRVDSYREARAALNVIASDLESLFPLDDREFFDVTPDETNSAVYFLSAKPTDAQQQGSLSDICSVGYLTKFERPSPMADNAKNLYRYFRSSGTGAGDGTFNDIRSGDPFPAAEVEDLLARNITAFKVTAWMFDGAGKLVEFQQTDDKPLPDILEVSISAVNSETAAKLGNNEAAWSNRTVPPIEQAERTFTTRIRINQPAPTPTPSPTP